MSLVAYGSSDESDSEETSSSITSGSKAAGLFGLLPAPKKSSSGPNTDSSTHSSAIRNHKDDATGNTLDRCQAPRSGLLFDLPKPKKRTEPVKITIPQLNRDSDSDEDEPVRKRAVPQGPGTGLSSLLPQPKNMTIKETGRSLVPHTLTKRPDPKASKPTKPSVTPGLSSSSASPSAIKAAAKSAALQLARQMAADDQDSDEELSPENYFSLGDSSLPLPTVDPSLDPEPGAPSALLPNPSGAEAGSFQSDAPLEFGLGGEEASGSVWVGQPQGPLHPQYLEPSVEPAPDILQQQGYYNEAYYQSSDPPLAEADEPGSSGLFDDEAFRRLQGKRNRGKEEVKFLEIKGDDQLSGNQQWMAKSITEEKQERKSFSKKKGDGPTGQQRRKHQITYLIHQAKERELELKNNWAENKLTRRQTQAKYGF